MADQPGAALDGEANATEAAKFAALFKEFLERAVHTAPGREAPFRRIITEHLGTDALVCPVVGRTFQRIEHVNLQGALDHYVAAAGRSWELRGVTSPNKRFMQMALSDLLADDRGTAMTQVGPVEYTELPSGPGETRPCLEWSLALIVDGADRLAVFVRTGQQGGMATSELHLEVIAADRSIATTFLAAIDELMVTHNVYRGRVISIGRTEQRGPFPGLGIEFLEFDRIGRNDVVLADGVLDRVERHCFGIARHAQRLVDAGRHLRRGILLYGPPGTGKTHTVRYLAAEMPERTTIIVTAADLGLLSSSFALARKLSPSMVVLEDVDLIAEERTMPFGAQGRLPLLFGLLNELDGLPADCDLIAVLTTNRADLLEPALAARPGRIDLALEVGLPGADQRRRLIELYGRGLLLDVGDLAPFVERTDGVSPAFIKEWLRRAAALAADRAEGPIVVTEPELESALAELSETGTALARILASAPATAGAFPAMGSGPVRLLGNVPEEILRRLQPPAR